MWLTHRHAINNTFQVTNEPLSSLICGQLIQEGLFFWVDVHRLRRDDPLWLPAADQQSVWRHTLMCGVSFKATNFWCFRRFGRSWLFATGCNNIWKRVEHWWRAAILIQLQGGHALKYTLLYCLFHCKWDHHSFVNIILHWKRLETWDRDHKLISTKIN